MEVSALVWWEARTQKEMKNYSKIYMSWLSFIVVIKRQIYPLAYMQKAIMDWQNFRQLKGLCKIILMNLGEELLFWVLICILKKLC